MTEEQTIKPKKGMSVAILLTIGLLSVVLGEVFNEYTFIAIVGMITLPIAFAGYYKQRRKAKSGNSNLGVLGAVLTLIFGLISTMVILNIIAY